MIRAVLWAFVLVVLSAIYRVILNTWCLHRLRELQKEHTEYLRTGNSDEEWTRNAWERVMSKVPDIRDLFTRAGISDQSFTHLEPLGYGRVQSRIAYGFDNITTLHQDVQTHIIKSFHEAAGIFRKRRRDALNPLLLIETLLNLPASIVMYLGVNKDSVWPRLANVVAWVCGVIGFLIELPAFSDLQTAISTKFLALRHLLGL